MLGIRSIIRLAACVALAIPTSAATLRPQDMQSLAEAFDHIFTGIENMVTSLEKFNGDPAGVATIISNNAVLRDAVTTGTKTVKASAGMAIFDVIHIGGPLFVMENMISELMETLKSKKPELEKAGAAPKILEELTKDKTAVDALVIVINQNLPLPQLLGIIATPIGKLVTQKLTDGIKEWGGK